MTLSDQRCLFTSMLPALINKAIALGYQCAGDDLKRTAAQAAANAATGAGIPNSLHGIGLAIDLLLYRDGLYLRSSEDYRELGEFWKTLHPMNRWGGDFKRADGTPKPDGNHFSSERAGVK